MRVQRLRQPCPEVSAGCAQRLRLPCSTFSTAGGGTSMKKLEKPLEMKKLKTPLTGGEKGGNIIKLSQRDTPLTQFAGKKFLKSA